MIAGAKSKAINLLAILENSSCEGKLRWLIAGEFVGLVLTVGWIGLLGYGILTLGLLSRLILGAISSRQLRARLFP
jgi:hypothetical protein